GEPHRHALCRRPRAPPQEPRPDARSVANRGITGARRSGTPLRTTIVMTRGAFNLTMNTNDAIETAHAFPDAVIVPVHCDSWAHLAQDRNDLERSFAARGLGSRLRLLEPGMATTIELTQ